MFSKEKHAIKEYLSNLIKLEKSEINLFNILNNSKFKEYVIINGYLEFEIKDIKILLTISRNKFILVFIKNKSKNFFKLIEAEKCFNYKEIQSNGYVNFLINDYKFLQTVKENREILLNFIKK